MFYHCRIITASAVVSMETTDAWLLRFFDSWTFFLSPLLIIFDFHHLLLLTSLNLTVDFFLPFSLESFSHHNRIGV